MDITRKTTAELIDQLITTSNFCWHVQDEIMDLDNSEAECGKKARDLQRANARRMVLIRAIDVRLNETHGQVVDKTYV
jgi:hypothetical protein